MARLGTFDIESTRNEPRQHMELRRKLFSASLPVAAALLMLGGLLIPVGLDKPITTISTAFREIPIAHAHAGRLYFSYLLVLFGLAALGVSFAAIATLVRDRAAGVATAAALVGGLAGFCGVVVNVLIGYNLAAAATSKAAPLAAAQVLVSANTSFVAVLFFVGYLGGLLVATVLTGIALWRSAAVPRWLAGLFVVGVAMGGSAPPGPLNVALSVPFAIAMVLLAVRISHVAEPMSDANANGVRVESDAYAAAR